jgi:outer membrane lipoprotein-sorting protein
MRKCVSFLLFACLLAGVSGSAAFAAGPEFSADFKTTDANGKVTTGKFFSKGDKIREEISAGKESSVMILRLDKKVSWTLMPNNQYVEVALPFDPANPQAYAKTEYEEKVIGTETVNGVVCQVIQTTYKDPKYGIMIKWVPSKNEIALKIQTKDSSGKVTSTTEFSNITKAQQPASLFELPAGYKKFALPFSF